MAQQRLGRAMPYSDARFTLAVALLYAYGHEDLDKRSIELSAQTPS